MERILNEDEKIRKAEEIYNRRNNRNESFFVRENNNAKKRYVGSRIGFQILILFNLALIVFCVQNRNFIFKEEFINMLMSYQDEINEKINVLLKTEENINMQAEENIENNVNNEIQNENEETKDVLPNTQESNIDEIVPNEENVSSMSQMDIDVQNLKSSYNFVKPIEGVVSSGFGARESEYQNVEGYHTGIDIAAEKGTSIKSAFNGVVSLVSSEGDYGKHLKIRCNNVTLLYAHCSKILVKEGDFISEGQEIAKVGSTGNSTGPHLHFEIRVDDRYIDPQKLVNF